MFVDHSVVLCACNTEGSLLLMTDALFEIGQMRGVRSEKRAFVCVMIPSILIERLF